MPVKADGNTNEEEISFNSLNQISHKKEMDENSSCKKNVLFKTAKQIYKKNILTQETKTEAKLQNRYPVLTSAL